MYVPFSSEEFNQGENQIFAEAKKAILQFYKLPEDKYVKISGLQTDESMICVTADLAFGHLSPCKYDLHIFDLNGKRIKTAKDFLSWHAFYNSLNSCFSVNAVLPPEIPDEACRVVLRYLKQFGKPELVIEKVSIGRSYLKKCLASVFVRRRASQSPWFSRRRKKGTANSRTL